MRHFVLVAIFAILGAAPAHADVSCTLRRIAQLPFESDAGARPLIPATIEGRKTRMLVDTGGWWSVLHKGLANDLKLQVRPTELGSGAVDIEGNRLTSLVTIPKLKLGEITFDFPFDFLLGENFGRSFADMGGTLGLNVFARVDLEIDNAGRTISMFRQDHCKGAGPYWADSAVTLTFKRDRYSPISMPIVDANLDGEPIRVLIDTGSVGSFLSLAVAKRRLGIGPGSPGVEPVGLSRLRGGSTTGMYRYRVKVLTLSGIRFENVPVHLFELPQDMDDGIDLILGMNEIKHLRLYFAFKDRMIHVTAADATR